ncbi:conserved protein of unknown function [Pseudomonas marincola]|uniref:Uncharacterized protein n=1 Tax=Pseudomonas marincola TaxID=437900 RepID=A0A653E2E4_9PSED|nr:conserved protein of unknown function [Pseudomonas marincola]
MSNSHHVNQCAFWYVRTYIRSHFFGVNFNQAQNWTPRAPAVSVTARPKTKRLAYPNRSVFIEYTMTLKGTDNHELERIFIRRDPHRLAPADHAGRTRTGPRHYLQLGSDRPRQQ